MLRQPKTLYETFPFDRCHSIDVEVEDDGHAMQLLNELLPCHSLSLPLYVHSDNSHHEHSCLEQRICKSLDFLDESWAIMQEILLQETDDQLMVLAMSN